MMDNEKSSYKDSTGGPPRGGCWFVYIIRTAADRLYTGITTDPARRLRQHESGRGGAKYFRLSRPADMVYLEECGTRSAAARREAEIKRMRRPDKLALVARGNTPGIHPA